MASMETYQNICPELTGKPWCDILQEVTLQNTPWFSCHQGTNILLLSPEKTYLIYVTKHFYTNQSKGLRTYLFH